MNEIPPGYQFLHCTHPAEARWPLTAPDHTRTRRGGSFLHYPGELIYGAAKSSQTEQNLAALEQFLLPLELVNFDESAATACGQIRAGLECEGKVIGSMDMLIAIHALSLNTILVTNNTKEFGRVSDLLLDDSISDTR